MRKPARNLPDTNTIVRYLRALVTPIQMKSITRFYGLFGASIYYLMVHNPKVVGSNPAPSTK